MVRRYKLEFDGRWKLYEWKLKSKDWKLVGKYTDKPTELTDKKDGEEWFAI